MLILTIFNFCKFCLFSMQILKMTKDNFCIAKQSVALCVKVANIALQYWVKAPRALCRRWAAVFYSLFDGKVKIQMWPDFIIQLTWECCWLTTSLFRGILCWKWQPFPMKAWLFPREHCEYKVTAPPWQTLDSFDPSLNPSYGFASLNPKPEDRV